MEFQYNKGIITYYCNGKKVGTINTTDVYTSIDITNTSIQLWLQNWFYTDFLGNNKRRGYIYDLVVLDDIIHTENYTLPVTYLDKFFYGIVEKDDNGYGILKI